MNPEDPSIHDHAPTPVPEGAVEPRVLHGVDAVPSDHPVAQGVWVAERSAQVEEEPAQRAGDTEQNALPPRLLADDQPAAVAITATGRVLPTTLTAAADAAAFVAQIFADTKAEQAALADKTQKAEALASEVIADDVALEPQADAPFQPLLGQNILILGLGASGLAMARWCVRTGAASVTVADTRDAPPQLATLQQELPQVRFVAGPFDASLVDGQNIHAVYRSPGLSPDVIAPVLIAAQASDTGAGGELSLYVMALQTLRETRGYAPAVLAITGTNGKTTVTSLTGQLVAHAGKTVAVAGNIGPTLLDTLAAHLDANTLPEVWVLELSSFQLDGVTGFEPTAAVVLNVTQDHLDWHGSMDAYAGAKARIFGATGLMVLNRDDVAVMGMLPPPVRAKLQKPVERPYTSFGTDMPQRPGDFGIEEVNGMVWLVRALEADETRRKRKEAAEELHFQRLMPVDVLRIRGRHNASNALAALALCAAAGCALGPILFGLREYRGEPHRVEPIGILNDVEFFDDSKGTNVGATVAALQGLGADRKVVLILGGEGKGQDFAPLAAPVARYARAVVLIGRDAPLIRAALDGTGVTLTDAESMDAAVVQANQRAHAGDAVLMSPACASFDMFDNYEHRARVFIAAVRDLALAAGVDLESLA
ncbi:UDP-N-acetylmuramoyl-L-alanine--D-glutamate ligase [Rhodoferax sp. AJA081-3]|uniref:UDP-N-acetylmuramoyl-L-alanine--D-glutamate ligase n=1 Tax=Rhodoferax sp. AJA081-3 TaxID=2752316 RepID=UPI001ADF121D|nr:UDP-N-acetylmuramoyl-L-alanine--D-glutamate ligase [Rhodoferax sp. AJA081-3]QTN27348.1 UDP-N-acetylmuramoyl-L-alanine--D-glutamate ligase [Rhodoferax sp. AJA081-3]